MNARTLKVIGIGLALIASHGCGSKKQTAAPGNVRATKRVEQPSLPAVGAEISGLDGGRLSISPPANWFIHPKDSKFLAKFSLFKRGESPLPLIVVTVDDSPFAQLKTVTEEELEDFAISMTEIVNEQGGKVLEKVRPMIFGGVPAIRYVKAAKLKFRVPKMQSIDGERQIIQTLAGGRLYTIDLRVRKDTIPKFRDQAYAVVASMKFTEADSAAK